MLEAQSRIPVQPSTIIALIFGFAAIVIIVTSACIIFYHRRRRQPSSISETMSKWGRNLADADRQSDSIGSRRNERQQNFEQVPMLQPMAFLQGREGPKEFVGGGGGGKRRSSSFPRLIADGMGGIWPRRHSVWTLNSNHVGEEEEGQGGTLSRPTSKKSHRSRRSSKATIGRKNGSHLSTSSAKPTTTIHMGRTIVKKPSVTSEPSPSLSASPSAFLAPRIPRNTSASISGPPSSYKTNRLRHQQGESFLEDDIHEDELQSNYVGSVSSAASSSMPRTVDLAAFPVPPLPSLTIRNHVNDH